MGNGSKYLKTWQQHEAGMSSAVRLYWHIWVLSCMYCKLAKVFIAVLHTPPAVIPVLDADECCHHPFRAVFILLLTQTVCGIKAHCHFYRLQGLTWVFISLTSEGIAGCTTIFDIVS